jgi:hypothetical protein
MPPKAPASLGYPKEEEPMTFQAPVSRSGGSGSYSETSLPTRVVLSRAELEIAAACHLTPGEFAKQKLELARQKKLDPDRYGSRG